MSLSSALKQLKSHPVSVFVTDVLSKRQAYQWCKMENDFEQTHIIMLGLNVNQNSVISIIYTFLFSILAI